MRTYTFRTLAGGRAKINAGSGFFVPKSNSGIFENSGTNYPSIILRASGVVKGYAPAVVTASGGFFTDATIGDIAFRTEANKILFGSAASTGPKSTMSVGTAVGIGNTSPNSSLQISGSLALAYVAKTAAYTATATDYTIDCNGTFTVTLPTSAGITGRIYVIKNSGTGTITLAGTSAQTFDGNASPTIATQFGILRIQSNGTNWIVL